ncbi:hypothetical protein HPP92_014577 [Vanilla planifolia]|uniref:Uncharacterized protein n=1 Tax=Vanilla planifolia TaxID=51239 RepID=A0A835QK96_VANPL|nr:hypothetical protein HPP92_014577 [Vanilla planifolia]
MTWGLAAPSHIHHECPRAHGSTKEGHGRAGLPGPTDLRGLAIHLACSTHAYDEAGVTPALHARRRTCGAELVAMENDGIVVAPGAARVPLVWVYVQVE